MAERWERTMPCKDPHKRRRHLRIYIADDNTVGLHTPPGEAAEIHPADLEVLKDILAAAFLEATHRGADWR